MDSIALTWVEVMGSRRVSLRLCATLGGTGYEGALRRRCGVL